MLRDTLQELIESALPAAQASGQLPDFPLPEVEISRPKQAEHGDYATNIAMITAAAIRKATGSKSNPRQIAQAIVEHLPESELIASVELAGPGFINIRLSPQWLQQQIAVILESGDSYGSIERGNGQYWQVEYVSANPTGPIHYGGARNAVIGDSLANVLETAGYRVQREFYVNDAGTQFRIFAETLYARYAQLLGQELPIPENGYQGQYMIGYAQQIIDTYGDQFLAMEHDIAVTEIQKLGREIVIDALQKELGMINVTFDNWFSEQSLYDEGLIEQMLDYLKERGEIVQRDGAVWFTASNYPKNDKDEVVIRTGGAPTYFASDIAYHYDKLIRRKFDKVINVWGADHQGHAPRMAALVQAFGLEPERLTILFYDLVNLIRNGKEVKMGKRSGNFLSIQEVVEEVGADAIRFNLLRHSPESTLDFDLSLAVEQTEENPIHYVHYSHARICSILNKAREKGFQIEQAITSEQMPLLLLLNHESELILLRKMIELENEIDLTIDKLSAHNLTYYAIDLAKKFNAFYRDCKAIDLENLQLSQARLLLCQATRIVLARVLSLVGVSAPESM